jgi:hypothetical protein
MGGMCEAAMETDGEFLLITDIVHGGERCIGIVVQIHSRGLARPRGGVRLEPEGMWKKGGIEIECGLHSKFAGNEVNELVRETNHFLGLPSICFRLPAIDR